jgi:hypothetical protein
LRCRALCFAVLDDFFSRLIKTAVFFFNAKKKIIIGYSKISSVQKHLNIVFLNCNFGICIVWLLLLRESTITMIAISWRNPYL